MTLSHVELSLLVRELVAVSGAPSSRSTTKI
jgi:hypothetical protein